MSNSARAKGLTAQCGVNPENSGQPTPKSPVIQLCSIWYWPTKLANESLVSEKKKTKKIWCVLKVTVDEIYTMASNCVCNPCVVNKTHIYVHVHISYVHIYERMCKMANNKDISEILALVGTREFIFISGYLHATPTLH